MPERQAWSVWPPEAVPEATRSLAARIEAFDLGKVRYEDVQRSAVVAPSASD